MEIGCGEINDLKIPTRMLCWHQEASFSERAVAENPLKAV